MDLNATKLLSTERLQLFVPNASFAEPMVDFLIRNKSHFKPVFYAEPEYYQVSFWREAFKNIETQFQKQQALYLVMLEKKQPDKIIGNIVFDGIIRGALQSSYLGYKIDRHYQGQGLMLEALKPSIHYIFHDWKLHRIMANYQPQNKESALLLKKLGFKVEGVAHRYMYIDGAWRDHVLTSLTHPAHIKSTATIA